MSSGFKGVRLDSLQMQRLVASHSIQSLAKKANVSDWVIKNSEAGGNLEFYEAQRIADALGVSLVTLGKHDL